MLQNLVRLGLDIFTNKFSTGRVKRDLTRGVDKLATADGLTIRANSCGRIICADLCTLHSASSQTVGAPLAGALGWGILASASTSGHPPEVPLRYPCCGAGALVRSCVVVC